MNQIPGLYVIENFISEDEEYDLLSSINNREWDTTLSRRTQHYGYRYNYKGSSNSTAEVDPIPGDLNDLGVRIHKHITSTPGLTNLLSTQTTSPGFNQIIVNEYTPGQGISAHVDDIKQFGDIIAGVSLGSNTTMEFINENVRYAITLPKRSLLILSGEARYKYKHSIPARKSVNGQPRGTRVSITYRHKL